MQPLSLQVLLVILVSALCYVMANPQPDPDHYRHTPNDGHGHPVPKGRR
jgi:hypothetical protein